MPELETADPDLVSTQVRTRLRELTLPLREELEQIDKRLVALNRERDDLNTARREITRTIEHLQPSQAKANGTAGLAKISYEKKKAAIIEYLQTHRAKVTEQGITAADLNRMMREDKAGPPMSPHITMQAIKELHQAGLLRADRIVRGGAQLYYPVGK